MRLYIDEQLYYNLKLIINECIKRSNYYLEGSEYNKCDRMFNDYRHLYEKYEMKFINDTYYTKNYLKLKRDEQFEKIEIEKNEIINKIINISKYYNINDTYETIKKKSKIHTIYQLYKIDEPIIDF